MKVFDKTWKLAVAGALVGVLAALLAYFGNPANMAICIACFVRDTAGALKLHSAAPFQYFRPDLQWEHLRSHWRRMSIRRRKALHR